MEMLLLEVKFSCNSKGFSFCDLLGFLTLRAPFFSEAKITSRFFLFTALRHSLSPFSQHPLSLSEPYLYLIISLGGLPLVPLSFRSAQERQSFELVQSRFAK